MKIENIKAAVRVQKRIDKNSLALEQIKDWLKGSSGENSDGITKGLYGLYLSEFADGSRKVDLTGGLINFEVLTFIKEILEEILEERINEDLRYIK